MEVCPSFTQLLVDSRPPTLTLRETVQAHAFGWGQLSVIPANDSQVSVPFRVLIEEGLKLSVNARLIILGTLLWLLPPSPPQKKETFCWALFSPSLVHAQTAGKPLPSFGTVYAVKRKLSPGPCLISFSFMKYLLDKRNIHHMVSQKLFEKFIKSHLGNLNELK